VELNQAASAVADRFANVAREFCNWCEAPHDEDDSVPVLLSLLCRLYAAALSLPSGGPGDAEDVPDMPSERIARVKRNIARFDGLYYREFFDPDSYLDDGPVMGDVGDDLLDIYLDVRRGLLLFDGGDVQDALWYWRAFHVIHWGRHAVGAIFALHCLSIAKQDAC
jgi:Domain of unknown function (DUF5063)